MSAQTFDGLPLSAAPDPSYRAVPSRFPPVQAFDGVATPDDLAQVMELEGWTNDRLVRERQRRLPQTEWVYGRANSSVVMAAFLHGSPMGQRFTSYQLGAWYAAPEVMTCIIEVANGMRREIAQSALDEKTQTYRIYSAQLQGRFVNASGQRPDLHDPDSYAQSQIFGEAVRASDHAGILYDSVRRPGHLCAVSYRPSLIADVTQGEHLRLIVTPTGKVIAQRL